MSAEEEKEIEEKGIIGRFSDRLSNISYFQSIRGLLSRENRLAILVDGPNILRKVDGKQIKLEHVEAKLKGMGKILIKKVILDQYAKKSLMQAITNSGYEPIVALGDIYITMAIEAIEIINKNKKINAVAICSRHARIAPILLKLKEYGIETIAVGYEPGMSTAAKKIANHYLQIEIEQIV